MADARLKDYWLGSPEFDDLSDTGWRVFSSALMWSNHHGTDGAIPTRYLRMLHPEGLQTEALSELASAGLWAPTIDGYQLLGWVDRLGQSTAEAIRDQKAKNAARQQASRDKAAAAKKSATPGAAAPARPMKRDGTRDVTRRTAHDVSGDVTRDVMPHVGQDRDRDRTAFIEELSPVDNASNPALNSVQRKALAGWEDVAGKPPAKPVDLEISDDRPCTVCSSPLLSPKSKLAGICGKTDAAHNVARAA